MIVSAMPTIGKTTLSKSNHNVIDLDSGLFNDIKTNPNWICTYCKIALYLERRGYVVMVSFNEHIHQYLNERAQNYLMIAYDLSLKDYCLDKINQRLNDTERNWSLRTINWVINNFDAIVTRATEIAKENDINLILIDDPNYNLEEIIKSCER